MALTLIVIVIDCGISVHTRCVHHVNLSCAQHQSNGNGREDMQGSSLGLVGESLN